MPTLQKIGILLLSLFLTFSCRKKANPDPYLVMGAEDGVEVEYRDLLVFSNIQKAVNYRIDLDQDGIDDVELRSEFVVGTGAGVSPVASIRSLYDNCALLSYTTADTIFRHTNYQVSNAPGGGYAAIFSKTFSCRRESPGYVVDSTYTVNNIRSLNTGDQVSLLDDFRSGTFEFNSHNTSTLTPTQIMGDTTYYNLVNIVNDCTNFP